MKRDRPPAMTDVARVAGVSHQTVSRVLHDHKSVRGDTRARVLAAIDALGYRPNLAARALASRRTRVIGVLALESTLFGPSSTLYAIERATRAAGLTVTVTTPDEEADDPTADALERLFRQGVDGIVVIAPLVDQVAAIGELASDLPVVVVEGGEGAGRSVVAVDQYGGAFAATTHLLSHGARTVWHVAGPDRWFEARAREAGWRAALKAARVRAPKVLRGDWSPASGYAAGLQLARRDDVSAVFVANDQMALGVLRAFHEYGVDVPASVLLAGFDDQPECAFFTPPLTTVRQDFASVGRHAIDALLSAIEHGPDEPASVLIPAELIQRESSTPR